jgi:pilus assembly protein CpaB
MQNRLKLALVVAVFFGLVAAYGIFNFLRQQRATAEALRTETQDVVITAKDIPAGSTLNEELLKNGTIKAIKWPKSSVPAGSFSAPTQVVGKVNRVKIIANEPILESRLSGEGAGLTVRLEAGKRAMAVRVDEIIGVSGFIVPDDRVDVIVTTTPPGGSDAARVSKIVLQNKRVLSVAQSTEQKDGKPQVARSITLEVTPEDAEKLSLAYQEGPIVLALRGVGDDAESNTIGSNKNDLLSLAKKKTITGSVRPLIQVHEKYKVEVIHGSEKSVVEF